MKTMEASDGRTLEPRRAAASSRPWVRGGLLAVALAVWTPVDLEAAAAKPVKPSKTKVNPLALEFSLLDHIAKNDERRKASAAERLKFLATYGGTGYTVNAVAAGKEAASTHATLRKAAYLALTEPFLRAARARVKEFETRERIPIKPGRGSGSAADRSDPLVRLSSGVKAAISRQEEIVKGLRSQPVLEPRDQIRVQEQIKMVQERIERMQALDESIKELIPQIKAFDDLAEALRGASKKDAGGAAAGSTEGLAGKAAGGDAADVRSEAIGTQQVRVTLSKKKAEELRQALSSLTKAASSGTNKKIAIVAEPFAVPPGAWPLDRDLLPVGDFRIAEYVCGDELVATLFDCRGLWYRTVAFEFGDKLYVQVPPAKAGQPPAGQR